MTIATEEAERLAARLSLDAEAQQAARYQPYTDHAMRDAAATIRSLAAERDALQADNARLRETLLLARIAVSHASELSDRILYTQDLTKIDAALGETQ